MQSPSSGEEDMATGTVKLFHITKRYGFIQPDTGGPDVFVHAAAVRLAGLKRLRKGQKVYFEVYDHEGKPAARNLIVQADIADSSEDQSRPDTETLAEKNSVLEKDLISDIKSAGERRSGGDRKSISRGDLEKMLAEAIRTSHPDCKRLVGVIVEKVTPASPGEAGWAVKGVKYGNADRSQCAAALSIHLNQLQREFRIED
jgi:CspA family cold shock protein